MIFSTVNSVLFKYRVDLWLQSKLYSTITDYVRQTGAVRQMNDPPFSEIYVIQVPLLFSSARST